jgi:hypothetical protein
MKIAQFATIPQRANTLKIAARSMAGQVDLVRVFYDSKTDGNKFKNLTEFSNDEVIFICDDDIQYPADYVKTMMQYLKPGIVITCMGKIMKPRPIASFYRDEALCYKTFETCEELTRVEIPGTCAMAFYRSTCPDLDSSFFQSLNSDIWMGIYCKVNTIPCYVIPHKADWLTNLMPMLPVETPSVFDRFKNNDKHMTDLVNQYI